MCFSEIQKNRRGGLFGSSLRAGLLLGLSISLASPAGAVPPSTTGNMKPVLQVEPVQPKPGEPIPGQVRGYSSDNFDNAYQDKEDASATGTPEDRTFSDGPLSTKEMRFRNLLLPPVTCEEPLPKSALFPPMPQVPALPSPFIENIPTLQDPEFEKTATKHLETAKEFLKEERLQQASEELALAITYSPDELHMREQISEFLRKRAAKFGKKRKELQCNLLRLAVLYDQTNSNNAESLNQCLRSEGKKPDDLKYRTSLATQFESIGSYRLAVAEWMAVLKLDDTLNNHLRLSAALIAADCDREAISELRRLVRMDWPEDRTAEQSLCHRQLAEFFLKYSHHFRNVGAEGTSIVLLENAAMDARRAVILNPNDTRANKILFNVALEAIALCPNEADNHMLLAAAYLLKGDLRRAKLAYAECGRLDPSDPRLPVAKVVYHQLLAGMKLNKTGKDSLADSIASVKGLLNSDPKNDQLWVLLGRLHEQASDSASAKECFDKARAINWNGGSKESISP